MANKQTPEDVGFVPKGNEAAVPDFKPIEQGGATTDLDPNGNTLRVAGLKDNNNVITSTTANQADLTENQTDPWYDRPKLPDNSVRAPLRDPHLKTGWPMDGFRKDGEASPGVPTHMGGDSTVPERKPKPRLIDSFLAKWTGG